MWRYEICLFAGFELRLGGQVIEMRTQKARAALAYLTLEAGHNISRASLAGLLWPDVDEKKAAQSLRQSLSFIRQAFSDERLPSPLEVNRQNVQLNVSNSCWSDIAGFENAAPFGIEDPIGQQIRQADLFKGELLAGFFVNDAPEFETYLVARREAFRADYLRALESLAEHYLRRGEYAAARLALQSAIETDPWHESAYRGLMRVFALSGDVTGALSLFDQAERALHDGLGVAPLPATIELLEQIRTGRVAPAASVDLNLPDTLPSLAFSGRGEVHAELATALTAALQARADRSNLILIEGEAGAGKTRLVNEFSLYAQSQGVEVICGRSYEFEAAMPYQPLVDALRALDFGPIMTRLPDAWQIELGRLLPELRQIDPKSTPPLPAAGMAARQRLFEAALQMLLSAARPHGLVLFLDDLQWTDEATVDILQFLIRRSLSSPILFIGTYRPGEVSDRHPLTSLQRSLSRDRLSKVLALTPLDFDALAMITENLLGQPDTAFSEFFARESEGNPFVVAETLQTLFEQGQLRRGTTGWEVLGEPQSSISIPLRDTIRQRAPRLPQSAQQSIGLAAVIGRKFSYDLLQAIAGDQAGDDLEFWLQHRLVSAMPDGAFDFAHDKIREVISRDLSRHRRRKLHGQVAAALTTRHQGDLGQAASALAHHYQHSSDPGRAVPYLEQAAQQAVQLLAFSAVADLCDQGLALEPDGALHFVLLDMRQRSSQFLGRTEAEGQDAVAMSALARSNGSLDQVAKA